MTTDNSRADALTDDEGTGNGVDALIKRLGQSRHRGGESYPRSEVHRHCSG